MLISEIFHSIQGEGELSGRALRVRAHQRLQSALRVVRHALRVMESRGYPAQNGFRSWPKSIAIPPPFTWC
jgi:hypothetical protein